jgi:hypothetical protein
MGGRLCLGRSDGGWVRERSYDDVREPSQVHHERTIANHHASQVTNRREESVDMVFYCSHSLHYRLSTVHCVH